MQKVQSAPRFVVQLAQSTRPIDPLDVPQLEVFDLYHLYCVSAPDGGEMQHALRLGHFKEPGYAKAIAAYLAPYFRHPLIVPVSAAEIVSSLREKFLPQKDIGASGTHSTVVLATPEPIARVSKVSTQSRHPAPSGNSLWSRMLELLRRPVGGNALQ
jgi:hypothetical protein